MKITLEEGVLDVPKDFALEMEFNHPFYSDAGSSSVPASLPASIENRRILGWPEKANRSHRYLKEHSAFVECGAYRKPCKLITESAGLDGISASIVIQESEIYMKFQDRKLKDLLADLGYGMTKSTIASPGEVYRGLFRDNWYLNDVACFPVASDIDDDGNVFIINRPTADKSDLIDSARSVIIDKENVNVPAGYGISMYMYLWALIQYTFDSCGYSIGKNVFATDGRLKHLVVLNSLSDLLNVGTYNDNFWAFRYSDMVPDITVGELICWLHDKFGAIVTQDSGKVNILLAEHLMADDPDADLTEYHHGNEVVSYPAPAGLKISSDHPIDSSEPAAESLEDLRKTYRSCTECATMNDISGTGLFKVLTLGKYYYRDSTGEVSLVGSDAFPYTRSDGDKEEYSPQDVYVPMVEIDGVRMPYIGARLHKYTANIKDSSGDQELMICNAIFASQNFCGTSYCFDENGRSYSLSYDYPTPEGIHGTGLMPSDTRYGNHLTLTPEGLKEAFWQIHESNLLNSAPEISGDFTIPVDKFMGLDLYTPKLFKGNKVMIKSLTYALTGQVNVQAKAILQLVNAYEDALIPSEVGFDTSLVWKVKSTRTIFEGNGYSITDTDGLSDYSDDDAPNYTPSSSGITVKRRSRWLKYKYTKKVKKWWGISTSTFTGTHNYEEYFISEATE